MKKIFFLLFLLPNLVMSECRTWEDGTSTNNGNPVDSCEGKNNNTTTPIKSVECKDLKVGEFCGSKNGYGKFKYENNAVYEGNFKNGKPVGLGKIIFPGGTIFYGNYTFNGKGKLVKPDGTTLEGNFLKGMLDGQGTLKSPNIGTFSGSWKNGVFLKGKTTSIAGFTYEGPVIYNQDKNIYWRSGFGKSTYADGSVYEGDHLNDKETGKGKLIGTDGIIWEGNFVGGVLEGQGTLKYSTGEGYEGQWKDGLQDGYGIYSFPNGDKQVGMFKSGTATGRGAMHFKDGCKLVGIFNNWEISGKAEESCPDGTKFVGTYKNNDIYGKGHMIYGDHYRPGGIKYGERKTETLNGKPWMAGDEYVGEYSGSKNGLGIVSRGGIKFSVKCVNGQCTNYEKGKLVQKKPTPEKQPKPNNSEPKVIRNKVIPVASGTGFVVSDDGHIVTNAHVVNGCSQVKLHLRPGEIVNTDIVSLDNINDLALLKANFEPMYVLSLSEKEPEILDDIIVAGYPFGYKISRTIKVTKGIISSLSGIGNNFSQIQIDAAIQPGNSGGPILDKTGGVVGVAVSKLDGKSIEKDFGTVPENVNFGIKKSVVQTLLSSNNVRIKRSTLWTINKTMLARNIKNSTFFLSCWMTADKIKELQSKKVMFEIDIKDFDE
ncbi:trypsin-like peptidase domain-containing protein [Methylophilaceae bacterium]|nr:trypsin-like peptidase domain-containing protein [Methylophilaceae bacterium]